MCEEEESGPSSESPRENENRKCGNGAAAVELLVFLWQRNSRKTTTSLQHWNELRRQAYSHILRRWRRTWRVGANIYRTQTYTRPHSS